MAAVTDADGVPAPDVLKGIRKILREHKLDSWFRGIVLEHVAPDYHNFVASCLKDPTALLDSLTK